MIASVSAASRRTVASVILNQSTASLRSTRPMQHAFAKPSICMQSMASSKRQFNSLAAAPSVASQRSQRTTIASQSVASVQSDKVVSATHRTITTNTVSAADVKKLSAVARPISPHVEIYSFPLPALTSITTRATGVALSVGVFGMSILALTGSCDIPSYVHAFQTSAPILVPVAKLIVAFPVVFHYVAGARHIVWDMTAKGLDLQTTEYTSQIVWGVSAVLTLILAFVTL